jgi:16S rRNA G527 N7-methylase RsmG
MEQAANSSILKMVKSRSWRPRVQAVRSRAEVWLAEQFVDTLVTRALGSVDAQLKLFGPVRGSFRKLVMLKGPAADDELEAASKTRHREGFADPLRHEVDLPGDAGRRLILVFDGDGDGDG